jgi:hypothetical protein
MLYGPDRRELRAVFFRAWRKHLDAQALAGAERTIVAVALRHPEYHALLENAETGADRDWLPEQGENPFLHLALHIAIEEQLALDQPRDIRAHYAELCRRVPDEHTAQHRMMECLGETLWQAQRAGASPDPQRYLDCLTRLAR